MKAMILQRIAAIEQGSSPLEFTDVPDPEPGEGEILIRVHACGVCHTELDEMEGRAAPPRLPVIPGHQVVGRVERLGTNVTRHRIGDRVGVGWIHRSTGAPDENLSAEFLATGRDVNGGYAERMTVPEDYAYAIPAALGDAEAAPLLCAGAVGYRALMLTGLRNGEPLGLTGFGASARLVLQTARHLYPQSEIFVFARDDGSRDDALKLGAAWAGGTEEAAPRPLHAIIDTTPAWKPVVEALANLKPGGRLVINAIRKEDADKAELLRLDYGRHLWMEREIRSVANVTQWDVREFLRLAGTIGLRPEIQVFPLEQANAALVELRRGSVRRATVLQIAGGTDGRQIS
jgi:propanol-preferring alcohol dehydrogenase